MSLSSTLLQIIDSYVQEWIQTQPQDSVDTMLSSWNDFLKSSESNHSSDIHTSSSAQPVASKTVPAYVQFCNVHRKQLKDRHPTMSFGELSKELGRMWRELSEEERQPYTSSAPPPDAMVGAEDSSSSLEKKTLLQLREICSARSLKKTGNKEVLIRRIMEHITSEKKPKSSASNGGYVVDNERTFSAGRDEEGLDDVLTFEEDADSLCQAHRHGNGEEEDDDDLSNTSSASFQFDDDDDGDGSVAGF